MEKTTIDGVDIITDGDVTHFVISEDAKRADEQKRKEELEKKASEPKSFLGKILNWFKTSKITPYVKIRDLADPIGKRKEDWTDTDVGNDGKSGVEVGIKIKF